MNQGNLLAWRKKEGDEVAAGDILAEVETDKVGAAPTGECLHAWQGPGIGGRPQPCTSGVCWLSKKATDAARAVHLERLVSQ